MAAWYSGQPVNPPLVEPVHVPQGEITRAIRASAAELIVEDDPAAVREGFERLEVVVGEAEGRPSEIYKPLAGAKYRIRADLRGAAYGEWEAARLTA